jgi:hypothetical protein
MPSRAELARSRTLSATKSEAGSRRGESSQVGSRPVRTSREANVRRDETQVASPSSSPSPEFEFEHRDNIERWGASAYRSAPVHVPVHIHVPSIPVYPRSSPCIPARTPVLPPPWTLPNGKSTTVTHTHHSLRLHRVPPRGRRRGRLLRHARPLD